MKVAQFILLCAVFTMHRHTRCAGVWALITSACSHHTSGKRTISACMGSTRRQLAVMASASTLFAVIPQSWHSTNHFRSSCGRAPLSAYVLVMLFWGCCVCFCHFSQVCSKHLPSPEPRLRMDDFRSSVSTWRHDDERRRCHFWLQHLPQLNRVACLPSDQKNSVDSMFGVWEAWRHISEMQRI